ncbi:MAG: SIMPL domain-containing protein [Fimbriimonadaceae bacterium]|nr:SIMPL domain-containing protein [Fimbriimonadaceae bacterium]
MTRRALFVLSCVAALVGCQPTPNYVIKAGGGPSGEGLVLTGTATVRVKPTLVVLRLGATFSKTRPVEAKTETEKTIKNIISAVKAAGIAAEDVQTTAFSLQRYDGYNGNPPGWRCTSNLEVRVKSVETAGTVLEAAMNAGANQVSGVDYTVEELQTVRAQARDEACKVAKDKAEQYARNFGLKLGAPTYISESSPQGWFYGSNYATQSMDYANRGESASQPAEQILSSGSVEVKLTVQVTYALSP